MYYANVPFPTSHHLLACMNPAGPPTTGIHCMDVLGGGRSQEPFDGFCNSLLPINLQYVVAQRNRNCHNKQKLINHYKQERERR